MRVPGVLLLAIALFVSGCGQAPRVKAAPALFMVRDADTVIWLFGTIHLLPANVDWQTPAMERAIDSADELVTEIPDQEAARARAIFAAFAKAETPLAIAGRVPPARRGALTNALALADLTAAQAARLDTWAVATMIEGGSARATGATQRAGVEAVLAARFARDGKPHRGLETLAGQLALFDHLPEVAQRALLASAIDPHDPATDFAATLAAWSAGDLTRLGDTLAPLSATGPALQQTLVTARNRRWAAWIAHRMMRPGAVLVAVGAGHLAGPQSVLAMIAAKGLKVTRVQ